MSSRSRRSRWVLVVLLLAVAGAGTAYMLSRPPSVETLFARARAARAKLSSIAFTLTSPWPQAQPAASALPGARALLGPAEGDRTWRVLWREDGSSRAEIIHPTEVAGTLTVVSPATTWVWSPLLGVVLVANTSGPSPLWVDQLLAMAAPGLASAQLAKGTALRDPAYRVDVPLAAAGEPGGTLSLWFDRTTSLPVRGDLVDGNGRLLGTVVVTDIQLSPGAGDDDFAFVPPAEARVLEVGSTGTLPDLPAAQAVAPVPVLEPEFVPAGFTLAAVNLFGRDQNATLVLTYYRPPAASGEAAGLLSLSIARAGSDYVPLALGMPVKVGTDAGRSFELGTLRGLDWRRGELSLTLFSTISATELMRVAVSIP